MEHINDEIKFLTSTVKGIARQFGDNCEVVLLDLTQHEKYGSGLIVLIENGHVTGRKVGDTGTNLGLEVLRGTDQEGDKHNYLTKTKDGRMLRSTTMYIRNSENYPVGCICINFDITSLMMAETAIKEFTDLNKINTDVKEVFVNNVNDVLAVLLQEVQSFIGKPVAHMSKNDKLKGIKYLDEKGAFLIQKSGDKICEYFGISKYTLYNYLDIIRKEQDM
ncbi:transcriptional regulator [Gracilibacillus thailandensis]|uniref:Transcriptional regulator n=2 Tax=Gracilibacillus thailandensis TaxID=563735 RepID=A0A6N7R1A6_9BACI|nr:helix-turn-helix transcriptional regulator [Gracilibacillus thailandensis]MRI66129.1 transcriptional regulator [Gracilibacillus thailandensis]